jgi:hypothetical protein
MNPLIAANRSRLMPGSLFRMFTFIEEMIKTGNAPVHCMECRRFHKGINLADKVGTLNNQQTPFFHTLQFSGVHILFCLHSILYTGDHRNNTFICD